MITIMIIIIITKEQLVIPKKRKMYPTVIATILRIIMNTRAIAPTQVVIKKKEKR